MVSDRELFVQPDGQPVRKFEMLKNPLLAITLERIATDPMSFYNGSLAEDIVADIAERGKQLKLLTLNRCLTHAPLHAPLKVYVREPIIS